MHAVQQYMVLIIDDEHVVADTLVLIFKQAGYQAKAVYSAEDALALSRTWPPHLAVLDIMLPEMNGLELAEQLKQSCPECRILLLSGRIEAVELLEANRNAGQPWTALPKPIPPNELLARARELLQA